jgi:LacI family transcriptional regulator
MTSIKDIALHCGVAISTVSRVLNNHPDVSQDTRDRVLQAAEALNYIPNTSARNLVRSSSDTIALLVKGVSNPFFSKLIKVIDREITLRGYTLELHQMDTSEDELRIGAQLANERKLIGILFLGGRFNYSPEEMALIHVPSVFCTYTNSFGTLDASAYSSVAIDDKQAACDAVDTLVSLGHRKIAILTANENDKSISELRFQGYKDALEKHGIAFDPNLVANTGTFSDMRAIYEATSRLIRRDNSFTAIFAIADLMAIVAIKALSDHGRSVPQDCSVVSIDGLDLSEYTLPTLTTLVQPTEEMGLACAKSIIDLIKHPSKHRQFTFETILRPGGSVRKISG